MSMEKLLYTIFATLIVGVAMWAYTHRTSRGVKALTRWEYNRCLQDGGTSDDWATFMSGVGERERFLSHDEFETFIFDGGEQMKLAYHREINDAFDDKAEECCKGQCAE